MNAVFNSIVKWESNYAMSYGCPLSRNVIMRQNNLKPISIQKASQRTKGQRLD